MEKLPSKMITQAYVFNKNKKYFGRLVLTTQQMKFSDTNIFPMGCIISMEKVTL